ncbi:MAG TPA: alpha/beta hydrolase [Thermoanaerobaculia bacterium]|nr:alpha/beta hydrolase [Thermoanaerobaculia bacterium]
MRPSSFFVLRSAFCVLLTLPLLADAFQSADGVTLHYERIGKGKRPIVLLPGGPGFSSEYMRPIAQRLSKKHSFVLFDQRGTGKSKLGMYDAETLDHKKFVADLEALRRELKLEKLTLVGHSWGGILSMLYASAHPDRVHALALIDSGGPTLASVPGFTATHTARMTAEDIAKVREWSAPEKLAADRRRAIFEITKARTPPYFHDRAKAQEFMDALTIDSFNGDVFWPVVGQLNATFDLRAALKNVRAPVLVIHGKSDPLQSAQEVHEAFAGSRLELIENAGHFPWMEQPEIFYRALDGFLRKVVQR